MDVLISLIAGAIGGNIAAGFGKNINLGFSINTLVGVMGGALGGFLLTWSGVGGLAQTLATADKLDSQAMLIQIAAGGLGGGALSLGLRLLLILIRR